jgi:predicted esterase
VGKGAEVKHVEVLIDFDGTYLAQELLAPGTTGPALTKPRATKIAQAKFAKLIASWPSYRGNFTEPKESPKPGTAALMSRPYIPGWYTFDQELMGERINGGQHTGLAIHQRDLDTEPLHIRVPKNYDPKVPCGVLVYIDPGEKGGIYPNFCPAADELGFIIVAAENTGNGVYREIRYQLALDGLANVAERYLIDPRRVYAMGISGGGQISTHLWLGFPDIFTGAIPIVALASYEDIPAGPGKRWAATLKKPVPKLLKMAIPHRCAAMTGGQDFNETIIGDAAKLLVRDGFNVHVYDYPDMGHQAPKADRFTDALKWVDEPYQTLREKEVKAAADALAKIESEDSLVGDARKKALIEVTRIGPWSPAAWRAAELLDVKPVSP